MTVHDFKKKLLDELYATYPTCSSFLIDSGGATQVVYGHGNPNADLMIIGEAPGQEEDKQGLPFVGRSGMLLTKALTAGGIHRNDVFITNVAKCRPPNNRTPTPQEIVLYHTLLDAEIKIIRPKAIILLGAVSLQAVLQKSGISKLRGTILTHAESQIVPTYHPAYVLRNPPAFNNFCQDIKKAINLINMS